MPRAKSYSISQKLAVQILIFLFIITASLYTFYSLFRIVTGVSPDFSIFYYATSDILNKKNPYTDTTLFSLFPYPLLTTFFYIPFTLFPYVIAQGIFTFLSAISVIGNVYLSHKLMKKNASLFSILIITSLAFLSFPVKFTLGMGQINLISLFFLLLSFYFFMNKKQYYTSLIFTLAICLKPILGLFMLFFILKKQYYIISIIGILIILLSILSFVIHGYEYNMYYLKTVVPHFFDLSGRGIYYNQGFIGFLSRITTHKEILQILNGSFVVINIVLIIFLYYKNKLSDAHLFAYISVMLVMIDTLSWQHHFVFLIFPFIFSYYALTSLKQTYMYILLFLSYALVSYNIKNPQSFITTFMMVLLSHGLYGAMLLWITLYLQTFYQQKGRLFSPNHKKRIPKRREKTHR